MKIFLFIHCIPFPVIQAIFFRATEYSNSNISFLFLIIPFAVYLISGILLNNKSYKIIRMKVSENLSV